MTSAASRLSRFSAAMAAIALAAASPALAQGSTTAQDDWIDIQALSWGSGDPGRAAGDEHEIEMDVHVGKAPPPPGPGTLSSTAPAKGTARTHSTPKLAQFAINGNALGSCRVGERFPLLRLADGRSRWVLTDVAVVRCGGGRMTVSYGARSKS